MLGFKFCLFQIAGAADFRLRSHAPLWLLWTLLPTCLSVFLFSLHKILRFLSPLNFSFFPVFPGSCWTSLAVSSDDDMMISTVVLVCALEFWVASPSSCCDLRLWGRLLVNLSMREPWGFSLGFPLLNYNLKIERFVNSISIPILENPIYQFAVYKYHAYYLEINKSFSNFSILSFLSELSGDICFFEPSGSAMASPGATGKKKGKQKVHLGTDYLADNTTTNCNSDTNSNNIPMLKLPSGGSSSKSKAKNGMGPKPDLCHVQKTCCSKGKWEKKKEFTLLGFLIGEPKDFARIFAKIRMEWKPLQGSMTLNVLKFGWFEIGFSNSADFQLIWANRPYHLFSQLLLLKQWYPGFDPTSESISKLDLWVRLHYLPEEFANAVALETIIEGNCVGTFLKMDPSHNGERWNMFTRFCITIDVEKSFGKGVIVPDEHLNQIKFSLWFDDFSPGCGACGKSAHIFRNCPYKNAQTPTIQLTIKKPSSRMKSMEETASLSLDNSGWNKVGKKNKVLNKANIAIPNGNIYLSERSGIKVIYESDDSDEGFQHLLDEVVPHDQPIFVSAAADLHPYNLFSEELCSPTQNKGNGCPSKFPVVSSQLEMEIQPTVVANDNKGSVSQDGGMRISEMKDTEQSMEGTPECLFKNEPPLGSDTVSSSMLLKNSGTAGNGEALALDHHVFSKDSKCHTITAECSEPLVKTLNVPLISNTSFKVTYLLHQPDNELSEYSEEQYDYEYDDLLVDDVPVISHSNLLPSIPKEVNSPIMISEDPPFSERDLEEFMNNDEMDGQNVLWRYFPFYAKLPPFNFFLC